MKNSQYAHEWLFLSLKHLKTAKLLFENNHYTDIIGIELQQSIEKAFKSIYAFKGFSIIKTHDLILLYTNLKEILKLNEDELDLLEKATEYYKDTRYPSPKYFIPSKKEISDLLEFTESLLKGIKKIIEFKDENCLSFSS